MEKVTRRTLKRWNDDAQDHAELGAALNGFSLNEEGKLAAAVEKTGQAVDATYISTARLVSPNYDFGYIIIIPHSSSSSKNSSKTGQSLLHEYAQFASIIKKILSTATRNTSSTR
jgi:hypothetical protein